MNRQPGGGAGDGHAGDGRAGDGGGAVTHAVELRGFTKRFGDVVAVDGVSVDIAQGELFGFIGPDGAGKTTLFRTMVTLLLPDAGSVRVLGLDVVTDLWALRSRVGYMPGRFSLYPDLSVIENLQFFASVFGTSVDAGMPIIEPIWRQLAPFAGRRAGALSGGMKQKLALCCALVHAPDILFLDEPTTGVDAVSRREFWDLLDRLRAGGLTIVVSTPYMDEASRCDRVALMQKGRLLLVDAPGDVSAAYPRPIFAVRAPDRLGTLGALRRFPHAAAVWPFGEVVHYTDARAGMSPGSIIDELEAFARAEGMAHLEVEAIEAGIEDAFMWHMVAQGAA
ncbi:MAG TPA: ABC transporter ATP-binding protein [Gemmatimonadaceae bacterium]|nr:ABC transporter ATP-binding protein [Gemmatimonadaceae bacterium]HMN09969.1 ABC transporter ATP-binding protein [Gemmatimonadaceae bacterium]